MGYPDHSEPENAYLVYKNKEVKSIFQKGGWLNYFNKMRRSDRGVAMEFSRSYTQSGAKVKGVRIQVDEVVIARISGFPQLGERWFEQWTPMKPLKEEFMEPGERAQGTEKGTRRSSLLAPWDEICGMLQFWRLQKRLQNLLKLVGVVEPILRGCDIT